MNRDEMMQEVDRRVTDRLMSHLVTATKHSHKRGWRDCHCSWCLAKRTATQRIGLISLPSDVPLPGYILEEIRKVLSNMNRDPWEGDPYEARRAVKKIRRDYMRQYYRTQLERLENE